MLNGIVPLPDTSFRTPAFRAMKLPPPYQVLAAMKPPTIGIVPLPDVSI
ncbi:MAG: hypothetical protein AB7R89_21455 [Dehalococcoidia bacterium]